MVRPEKLDFWIKNNYNVLMVGRHGTGKSTIVIEAFNRAGLKWQYFSASTMDPWVDFIGVPKEVQRKDGSSYLELVRPKQFQDDEIEALFFDEYNRSNKKVRNSVLELIQFKSINGKKFKNLRMVWAAVNPDSDDDLKYDVETLDKAQSDRFQIQIEIPYLPYLPYFVEKYGSDRAQAAVDWWQNLPEKIKADVSPRRLDYALDVYAKDGDMRDVLPNEANVSKLIVEINYGSISRKLQEIVSNNDQKVGKEFISIENNYASAIDDILKKKAYLEFFVPLMPMEKQSSLIASDKKVEDFVLGDAGAYYDLLVDIMNAGQNSRLCNRIRRTLSVSGSVLPSKTHYDCVVNPSYKQFRVSKAASLSVLQKLLVKYNKTIDVSTTQSRKYAYYNIHDSIPDVVSISEAYDTLKHLSSVISRTYKNSFNVHFRGLLPLVNHCFLNLYNAGEKDLRDVQEKHPEINAAIEFGLYHKRTFFYGFVRKT